MMPITRILILASLVVATAATATTGAVTTVTLRSTVRLAPEQPLTLGAIARIEGVQADALRDFPVSTEEIAPGAWTAIDAETIREALDRSITIHIGSLIVEGSESSVTRRSANPARSGNAGASPMPDPSVVTVMDHLTSWVRARLNSSDSTLKVEPDEHSQATTRTHTVGRIVEVKPIDRAGQIVARVTVYEGERIVLDDTVRLIATVEAMVPVATADLRRGRSIQAADIRTEKMRVSATEPVPSAASLVGQIVRNSLDEGERISADAMEPELMVERGDLVSVRMLSGSVVVNMQARARHDALDGEAVELESLDRSRRFTGRVAGKGRVVIASGSTR